MLTDLDDDFFFEEDKIPSTSAIMEDNTPILPIEALNFDITPICAVYTPSKPNGTAGKPHKSQTCEDLLGLENSDSNKEIKQDNNSYATGNAEAADIEDLLGLGNTDSIKSTVPSADLLGMETVDSIEEHLTAEAVVESTSTESIKTAASTCDLVDDDLLSSDVTATRVYSASSYDTEKYNDFNKQQFELERLGMTVSTKAVVIVKDDTNLIGISIGGGAPLCPCLYIVQVFDNTPAAREGSLESGDELLAINNITVKGKTKVQVAKMIQTATQQVTIHYNKLHADPERGKSLDIILKKLKHRIVDNMSSNTADTLGLSRAILCNDSLIKRLEELEGTEMMYRGLVDHARRMLKAHYDLLQTYRAFGDCFMRISTREPQLRASEAFRIFGEFHRNLEKDGLEVIKKIKPILDDMGTYLHKAIPDTKLTVKRYMDAKFTYLSYCLKVKEMDDEEHGFAAIQEPLYRVETGNYEYRLILRCRQDARGKFAKLRTDVLEKMELLECKHANDLTKQLRGILDNLARLNRSIVERMDALPHLFPIEVDFKETDFQYKSKTLEPQKLDEDEEEEANEFNKRQALKRNANGDEVVCGLEAVEKPAPILNVHSKPANETQDEDILLLSDNPSDNLLSITTQSCITSPPANTDNASKCDQLLKDFGLLGIDLNAQAPTIQQTSSNGSYDFDLFLNQKSVVSATATHLKKDLMACNALETDLLLQ